MSNLNIKKELMPQVYDTLLCLANPATGNLTVATPEIAALVGHKYNSKQIMTAIKYLERENKIKYIRSAGNMGVVINIPCLTKGNTVIVEKDVPRQVMTDTQPSVTFDHKGIHVGRVQEKTYEHPKDSLVELEKARMGLSKPAPTPPEKKVEELFKPKISVALLQAEEVLKQNNDVVGQILVAFLQTRDALDKLVREVRKNA